ncbi:hypothetical protein GWK16_11330 [Roseomonas sp. JC162]|uniref:Uncharacterized protein n=1 Tax=Neoroseomonas marina TaxID=1232220 RepID=A0A848ECR2_9PROT|nr:hypothetical protein [Neoroseomonas marina]NMJ41836.1 hypothetical protein [Neoroseomonas marina]
MTEIDWPEREADMALIREVNLLMQAVAAGPESDEAALALEAAKRLMAEYAAATRRFNAAVRAFLAVRTTQGSQALH